MFKRIKQYLCNHDSIETKTETGLNAIDQGYLFVKTIIICSKCSKSFPQHPHARCCYIAHIQNEMIRECILNRAANQINIMKQE